MEKYEINRRYTQSSHKQTVEAHRYRQEGEFFVFYDTSDIKVLTIAAGRVFSIDLVTDDGE